MTHGKNPHSYRLHRGAILDKTVEESSTEIGKIVDKMPTLADCVKYNIDIKHAGAVFPENLTREDYIMLREHSISVKTIRTMYGFKDHNQYYKFIAAFAISKSEMDRITKSTGIEEKSEFMDLETEQIAPIESEKIAEPAQADPLPATPSHKLSIITKHICPVCMEEYNSITDAETCLNTHAWVVGIEKTDGHCAFNCPPFIYAKMSDGRVLKYVAYGYEED